MTQDAGAGRAHAGVATDLPLTWEPSLAFVKYAIAAILAASAVYLVALAIVAPEQSWRPAAVIGLMLMTSLAGRLLARGRMALAVASLAIGVWLFITITAVFLGGISGTTLIIYPLVILLVGWLIGPRASTGVAVLTVLATLGFVIADALHVLPVPPHTAPVLRWLPHAGVFLISPALIRSVVRSYRERLEEVERLSADLAHRTAEIQAREADLHRAQMVAHVGSWVYDLVADVMYLSAETCRIFGVPPGTTGSSATYLSRVHPDDRDRVGDEWLRVVDDGEPFNDQHRILVGSEVRWIRQIAEIERGADGRPSRAIGTTQDVTERKRLEEAHQQAQKLESLGTLAGGIAHDFNNILAVIRGNARLAAEQVGPDHPAASSLDEITRATGRASDLVRRILTFSRPREAKLEPADLRVVVRDVLKLLRATVPARITLTQDLSSDVPLVLADAGQVHEAIVNLTTNAASAIGGHTGDITFRLDAVDVDGALAGLVPGLRPGRYARLTVRDSGSGMDAATLERIFDAFYTTKPVGEGTGLGLSMVHGILRGHGGAVTVTSAPGRGSTFELYFPETRQKADPRGEPGRAVPRTSGRRVLYVDDEEALVLLATRVLARAGHSVTGFSDPARALAAFREQPDAIDILVTDLSMPVMSGVELARAVLEVRPHLPVLLTTGHIGTQDVPVSRESGIRAMVPKPFTADQLAHAIDRVFADAPPGDAGSRA